MLDLNRQEHTEQIFQPGETHKDDSEFLLITSANFC
jgi:hypothetical protein